ncbi:MATE family efflux transporter [Sphingomonas abietis]|uniref:MATE family efflux transporter n=1 Tax=Sphingomonas abietis TaxID=3012344 RepID=A0ABY7NWD5_9SPHN|nr:MATE family efflux transporter [Sphingomonas abietis]WBO24209.1 MATE family efflux transporter [Sphingomonas abietis]
MDAESPVAPPTAAPGRGHGGRDLTSGPIARTLLLFALPTLAANILQSLNGSINAIWVGRSLGEVALAATSNSNLVMFLMLAAVFGFGLSATILVGQNMGRRDIEGARRAMGTAVGLFVIASVAIAIVGWLAAPAILALLATPPDATPLAAAYLRVIFIALPPLFLVTILTMGMRGTGDAMTPFVIMILNVALDSGLNPVFIRGLFGAPRMGIAGSATATCIAAWISLVVLVVLIYARDLTIRLRGAELRWLLPDPALLGVIVAKGIPIGLQMFVISFAGLAMMGLINHAGVDVVAAYGVTLQLWTYIQMPALAIGAAVSAMAAQNVGAGLWNRVDGITRWGIIVNLAVTAALILLVTLVDRPVLSLFLGGSSPALPIARHIQLVASWSFLMFGVTLVIFGTVRANGSVIAPLVILFVAMFPVRLGAVFALRPLIGNEAFWWTMPLSSFASMLMAIGYYRAGGWRTLHMKITSPREARA